MGHFFFFKFKLMAKINLATGWGSVTDAGVPAWAGPKFFVVDFNVYRGILFVLHRIGGCCGRLANVFRIRGLDWH